MPSASDLERVSALELSFGYLFADARDQAQAWLDESGAEMDPVLLRRVQLVKANADSRYGEVEHSALVMRSIRDWAAEHNEPYLQARAERWLSNLLRRAGEISGSLEHAVTSVRLLPEGAPAAIRADHLNGLADALAMNGSIDESISRYLEAVAVVETDRNVDLQLLILNNLAYTYYEDDRLDEAVQTCDRILAVTSAVQRPLSLHALDTIANIYLAVGRDSEAQQMLSRQEIPPNAPGEDVGELRLTLARVLRNRGELDGAESQLDQCVGVCDVNGLFSLQVRALRERAELYAARGDFERAFEQYKEFHERQVEHTTVEREARARMMHAIFETAEAKRESARFREMSYRDALTQLYNRRYVDEFLAATVERAGSQRQPLVVAFVDLDHFKAVNDTYSHEVGDDVLRAVASVLDSGVQPVPDAFAARMGGEEFLLVLPDTDGQAAVEVLEHVRSRVERIDWSGLRPGLSVTVSVGFAVHPEDGHDRLSLLAVADHRLYEAKRAGRNRVIGVSSGAEVR